MGRVKFLCLYPLEHVMDISSVKKATQPTQQVKRTESEKPSPSQDAGNKAHDIKPTETSKPRPVINSQGQSIGKRLNVTA